MLLVVSPNIAVDRILLVDHFQATKVQRTRRVVVQPGGKGSNVARVFRQLGGEVVLVGFVGGRNGPWIVETLRDIGVQVEAVIGYRGENRTCTIICDPQSTTHPTVVNEESPAIDPGAAAKLFRKAEKWITRAEAVLTTGSLSQGLHPEFYREVLDLARRKRKITAIDATGASLHMGLLARPCFMKPNAEEFRLLTNETSVSLIASHTALTFGKAGAALIHDGRFLYARPPRVYDINPIGTGDAFTAGYLKGLINRASAGDCLKSAMATACADAATVRPGFVERRHVDSLYMKVELHFQ
jgi:tagatose 6-phosphate kinase